MGPIPLLDSVSPTPKIRPHMRHNSLMRSCYAAWMAISAAYRPREQAAVHSDRRFYLHDPAVAHTAPSPPDQCRGGLSCTHECHSTHLNHSQIKEMIPWQSR